MPKTKTKSVPGKKAKLTANEMEVLRLIVEGHTYPSIAAKMKRGYETIKSWTNRIRAKIGQNTKVGMALWARENLDRS